MKFTLVILSALVCAVASTIYSSSSSSDVNKNVDSFSGKPYVPYRVDPYPIRSIHRDYEDDYEFEISDPDYSSDERIFEEFGHGPWNKFVTLREIKQALHENNRLYGQTRYGYPGGPRRFENENTIFQN